MKKEKLSKVNDSILDLIQVRLDKLGENENDEFKNENVLRELALLKDLLIHT